MTCVRQCLYVMVVCLMPIVISARANLDTSEPIVKTSPASGDDSFGFAVTLHQVEVPVGGNIDSFFNRTRIMVGAPNGTYPGGLDLPELNPVPNGGLVYQCPIRAGNCTGLTSDVSDPQSPDRRLFDGDPNFRIGSRSEAKSNQYMGSVLTSRAGLFVACAPRWAVIREDLNPDLDPRRPIGRCFVSPRNLQGFNELMACEGGNGGSSLTFRADNQCLTGFSASILTQEENDPDPTVVLGFVGYNFFNGNVTYYSVNSTTGQNLEPTFISGSFTTHPTDQYDGFSTTTGYVTNAVLEDSISAAPRYNGEFLTGLVRVRSQPTGLTEDTVIPGISGMQTGEYFGYCVATADLNGDRFDEVIVGAPMYSTRTSQEVGRVYIFENVNGNLPNTSAPILLTGNDIPLARFGTSVVNLGDINDDGFEDIAVGAPYESSDSHSNTGTVYIYYGTSSENGLISRSADQVLLANDIVDTVPGLTSLRTFGFSLSASDVDGNEFNDLVVGAYESKTAVLIRSLSVAYVNVSIFSEENIRLDRTNFTVTVCASYSGRALMGRQLNTTLTVSEVPSSTIPRRLYFGNNLSNNDVSVEFFFTSTNVVTCVNVDVFVRSAVSPLSTTRQNLLTPFELQVSFSSLPRRDVIYNGGDPEDLIDYRTIPVIILQGMNTIMIVPADICNINAGCRPDFAVTSLNITYPGVSEELPGDTAVVGAVTMVVIDFMYSNMGDEPAFNALLTFSIPGRYSFLRTEVSEGNPSVTCRRNSETGNFSCELPQYIPPRSQAVRLTLVWQLSGDLSNADTEDLATVSIVASDPDMDVHLDNNNQQIRIIYSSFTDLGISNFLFFEPPAMYGGIDTVAERPRIDQLGRKQEFELIAANRGPSTALSTVLDIYIPTHDRPGSYYIYLYNATITINSRSQEGSTCSGPYNPDNLPSPVDYTNKRRKRSSRFTRQNSETTPAPQSDNTAIVRNCSREDDRSAYCSRVRCTVRNFLAETIVNVTIISFYDGRFFQTQTAPFVFVAYANISSSTEDIDIENNQRATRMVRLVASMEPDTGSFPIWIPIVCGIVALIIIILLFVLLYFFGFFRRKKREEKEKEAEGDFEPPVAVPPADSVEGTPIKKPDETKSPQAPMDNDIGGTDDLQEGSIEKPDGDPDETSL